MNFEDYKCYLCSYKGKLWRKKKVVGVENKALYCDNCMLDICLDKHRMKNLIQNSDVLNKNIKNSNKTDLELDREWQTIISLGMEIGILPAIYSDSIQNSPISNFQYAGAILMSFEAKSSYELWFEAENKIIFHRFRLLCK